MEGLIRISVCCFCHDGQGRYVISKRSIHARDEHGTWEPCAGGLKFGETIEAGIRREVKEELCAELGNIEFLGYRDVHRVQNGAMTHWVALDFRGCVEPEEVRVGEPHKCDGHKWVTIDELQHFDEPLHSQFPFFLEKYKKVL